MSRQIAKSGEAGGRGSFTMRRGDLVSLGQALCLFIIGCKLNSEKEASLIPANLSRLCLRGLFSRAATVGAAYHNPVPVALCPQVKPSKVVL